MKTLNEITLGIQHGRIAEALEALQRIVRERLSDGQELRNSVIALLARYNQVRDKRLRGIVTDAELQITENQIVYGALELLSIVEGELNDRAGATVSSADVLASHRIKILFFAANPDGTKPLKLGQEVREIEEALSRARLRDRFELVQAHAARPVDFRERILREQPAIVHFSGHGNANGLYLLDDQDRPVLMSTHHLAEVFKLFGEVVSCVVLNACYSATQSDAIKPYVKHVIGTSEALPDSDAITFAANFYTALGEGKDIPFAVAYARLGVEMEGGRSGVFVG